MDFASGLHRKSSLDNAITLRKLTQQEERISADLREKNCSKLALDVILIQAIFQPESEYNALFKAITF